MSGPWGRPAIKPEDEEWIRRGLRRLVGPRRGSRIPAHLHGDPGAQAFTFPRPEGDGMAMDPTHFGVAGNIYARYPWADPIQCSRCGDVFLFDREAPARHRNRYTAHWRWHVAQEWYNTRIPRSPAPRWDEVEGRWLSDEEA